MSRECTECGERGVFWVEQNGRSRRLLCGPCTERTLAGLDPMAAQFLSHWLPVRTDFRTEIDDLPDETRCPVCGTTFAEFERTGLAGCAACYEAFEEAIMPALRILHSKEISAYGG